MWINEHSKNPFSHRLKHIKLVVKYSTMTIIPFTDVLTVSIASVGVIFSETSSDVTSVFSPVAAGFSTAWNTEYAMKKTDTVSQRCRRGRRILCTTEINKLRYVSMQVVPYTLKPTYFQKPVFYEVFN